MDTLESRVLATLEGLELAETLVRSPNDTIEPRAHLSTGGRHAIDALRATATPLDGRILTERTIGEGGMGVVHLATQATLGRHVAVKTLRDDAKGPDATLRMLREAWVTGALEHPNIVPIYDVGIDASGSPVIVMKRVEGRSWADLLRAPADLVSLLGAKDPVEANLRVFLSVCNAISFAHDRGILHRDIKPENVMIGAFGEVYVLDWGIAVSLREDPSGRLPSVAQATEIAGTPSYMAPEMLHAKPELLSERTDVYLLGGVLYEVFAGSPPHIGPTSEAMISSILTSRPVYVATFPAEARAICAQAMARDPADRFPSVGALRSSIEAYLAHRGSRRIAWEAKHSLDALLHAIEHDKASEERTLAIFNLLGACRFGYRAALEAWPDNLAARRGLDRALLAVVEHELTEGDPVGAQTLLREVSEAPADLAGRVDRALKDRTIEDERLRKIALDHDATVGTRTRVFLAGTLGVIWTVTPLGCWCAERRGATPSHVGILIASAAFLLIGGAMFAWARETLTKTQLNRQLARSLGVELALQMVLAGACWNAGAQPITTLVLLIASWCMLQAFLAVWVDALFGVGAAVCAAAAVAATAWPGLIWALMSGCNVVVTLIVVRLWFPRGDVAVFAERGAKLHRRARRMFLDAGRKRRAEAEEAEGGQAP